MLRVASVVVLAALLVGCAPSDIAPSQEAADRLVAPRHTLTGADGLPAGDLVASLDLRSGCLVLVTPDGNVNLALWPPTTRIASVDGALTVLDAGEPARLGDPVHVGGGQYGLEQRAFVEGLIGTAVDPACDVDGFWLVSEVLAD
jgi:hypothetical protein